MDYDSEDIEIWSDAAADDDDDDDIMHDFMIGPSLPDFSHQNPEEQNVNALMNWVAGFLLSLQAKYYIPDASINLLINFLFIFISVTGRFSTFMKCLANIFPKSLSLLLKMVKAGQDYTKFVVCRKCQVLYKYANCQEKIGSRIQLVNIFHFRTILIIHDGCPVTALFLRTLN